MAFVVRCLLFVVKLIYRLVFNHKPQTTNYKLVGICVLLLSSCANIVTPSGGPKDTQPPQVLSLTPKNFGTHFRGKNVRSFTRNYEQICGKTIISYVEFVCADDHK